MFLTIVKNIVTHLPTVSGLVARIIQYRLMRDWPMLEQRVEDLKLRVHYKRTAHQ